MLYLRIPKKITMRTYHNISRPDLFFYVTRIGCGIAGFRDKEIAPLFKEAAGVENICLPKSFFVR